MSAATSLEIEPSPTAAGPVLAGADLVDAAEPGMGHPAIHEIRCRTVLNRVRPPMPSAGARIRTGAASTPARIVTRAPRTWRSG